MANGARSHVLTGFSWLLAEKVLALGGTAIVGILVARHLGPHDYGLYAYVVAIAGLAAALSGLGLQSTIARDLAYQPDDEGRVLGTISALTTAAGVLVTIGTAIWIAVAPAVDPRISWLIVLVVASSISGRFEILQYWFIAHRRVRVYALSRALVTVVFLLVRLGLLLAGADLTVFLLTFAAETAIGGIRCLIAYRMSEQVRTKWEWSVERALHSIKRSWPVLLSGIMSFIYLKVDTMLITWWRSPAEAGVYAAAARISELWYFVPTLFMSAAFPSLLKLRVSDPVRYEQRLRDVLDLAACVGTIVALAITFAAPVLIPFLFGPEFAAASSILMIHVWAGIFVFMRAVLTKWLVAEELYVFSLMTHGSGAAINLAINYVLIPEFSGLGAAIATLVSYATAGYLSLLLHKRTRPLFYWMSLALLWPRRLPDVLKFVRGLRS